MEMKRKENRQRLWESLEMGEVKRHLLVLLIFVPVLPILAVVRSSGQPSAQTWSVAFGAAAVSLIPFLGFYVVRTIRILRKAEYYIFCRAELNEPHSTFFTRSMYFTVRVEDTDGTSFYADTHAIFGTRNLIGIRMEDYVNQEVTIGYNSATGMVVVIG